MNAAPNPPSAFKTIVPSPTATLCGNFLRTLLQLPLLIWQHINWMLNNDGTLTNAFCQQVLPPGFVFPSAALYNDETKFLLCDGREVAKSDYPDLYAAIQDTYGTASSASNFKIPDFSGLFMVGVGAFQSGKAVAIAQEIGAEKVTLTADQMPPHQHDVNGLYAVGLTRASNSNGVTNNNALADAVAFTLKSEITGGSGTPAQTQAHDNVPPAIGIYYYIKV